MVHGSFWQRYRVLIPVILLGMILARLVWMELRDYPVHYDVKSLTTFEFLASLPGGCTVGGGEGTLEPPPGPAGGISFGYAALAFLGCQRGGELTPGDVVKFNQWVLVATVLMGTLLVRFLTSSWTVALVAAVVLMSRGHLLANLGRITPDWLTVWVVTAFLAAGAHFIRTGALVSAWAAAGLMLIGALFDKALLGLALAWPLACALLWLRHKMVGMDIPEAQRKRTRQRVTGSGAAFAAGSLLRRILEVALPRGKPDRATGDWRRGSLVRTLDVGFIRWMARAGRLGKLAAAWTVALVVASFVVGFLAHRYPVGEVLTGGGAARALASVPQQYAGFWIETIKQPLDMHLTASLVVIGICLVQSPREGLAGFFEGCWLTVVTALVLVGAAFLTDVVEWRQLGLEHLATTDARTGMEEFVRPVTGWLEPVVLSLGVAGVYNLMKVWDSKMARQV